MRISDSLAESLLKSSGSITKEQLISLRKQSAKNKRPLQDLIIKNSFLSEQDLTKRYAQTIDLPFIELKVSSISPKHLKLLPERVARRYGVIVFSVDDEGNKLVAMEDPDDPEAIDFLKKLLGSKVKLNVTTASAMRSALDHYSPGPIKLGGKKRSGDNYDIAAESSALNQAINIIIERAIRARASDIHIEPRENYVVVRYRVDGHLREVNKLPLNVLGALVANIKSLASLRVDEQRTPQEGRFNLGLNGQTYSLRVSTLPTLGGEKVVMRILNKSSKAPSLQALGLWGKGLKDLQHALAQPHGMILVSGPNNSGKSTSLFSLLSLISTPHLNISTIEDPIEYNIPGVNQVQINPSSGMNFNNGLQAVLAQDPNVIMVGEINDRETADLTVKAASSGHLVLSSLHTMSAAKSLKHLVEMSTEPFLVASTLRVVMSQRLARRLCPQCRESLKPDSKTLKQIEKLFHLSDQGGFKQLHTYETGAISEGIMGEDDKPSSTSRSITRLYKASKDGCSRCNYSGYNGRVGIYEVLVSSVEVQKLITTKASGSLLEKAALEEGMMSLQMDGLVKALRGLSTVEEVLRATS